MEMRSSLAFHQLTDCVQLGIMQLTVSTVLFMHGNDRASALGWIEGRPSPLGIVLANMTFFRWMKRCRDSGAGSEETVDGREHYFIICISRSEASDPCRTRVSQLQREEAARSDEEAIMQGSSSTSSVTSALLVYEQLNLHAVIDLSASFRSLPS